MSELAVADETSLYSELQELFTRHLRSRVMLKDVIRAEHEILSEIVEMMKRVPEGTRTAMVGRCVDGAARELVHNPS